MTGLGVHMGNTTQRSGPLQSERVAVFLSVRDALALLTLAERARASDLIQVGVIKSPDEQRDVGMALHLLKGKVRAGLRDVGVIVRESRHV